MYINHVQETGTLKLRKGPCLPQSRRTNNCVIPHPSTEPRRTLNIAAPQSQHIHAATPTKPRRHLDWTTPYPKLSHGATSAEQRRTLNVARAHPHPVSTTPVKIFSVNGLLPASFTQVINIYSEYLREFWEKFEMAPMKYRGQGDTDPWENLK